MTHSRYEKFLRNFSPPQLTRGKPLEHPAAFSPFRLSDERPGPAARLMAGLLRNEDIMSFRAKSRNLNISLD